MPSGWFGWGRPAYTYPYPSHKSVPSLAESCLGGAPILEDAGNPHIAYGVGLPRPRASAHLGTLGAVRFFPPVVGLDATIGRAFCEACTSEWEEVGSGLSGPFFLAGTMPPQSYSESLCWGRAQRALVWVFFSMSLYSTLYTSVNLPCDRGLTKEKFEHPKSDVFSNMKYSATLNTPT